MKWQLSHSLDLAGGVCVTQGLPHVSHVNDENHDSQHNSPHSTLPMLAQSRLLSVETLSLFNPVSCVSGVSGPQQP